MINLCLVVIATQFSETKRRETAKMKAERARFRSSSTLSSFTNSETTNCYREIIKLIAHLIRKAVKRTRATYRTMKIKHLKHKERVLLEKKETGKLQNYNVMKNVSTHSMVNVNDGIASGHFTFPPTKPLRVFFNFQVNWKCGLSWTTFQYTFPKIKIRIYAKAKR